MTNRLMPITLRLSMQAQPLVSIAIPVYNRERLIEKAVTSALAQTYRNIEVVVCDNCSTDNTFAVLERIARGDSRLIAHRNERNLGPVPNWITCAKRSRGEFIWLLFSDDWLEPNAIERLLPPLISDVDVGFAFSAVHAHGSGNDSISYRLNDQGKIPSVEYLIRLMSGYEKPGMTVPVSPGCALFRRADMIEFIPERLPTFGDFDTNRYGIGNDVSMYLRCCEKYPYFFHLHEPLTHFLAHSTSFSTTLESSSPFLLARSYCNAYRNFLREAKLAAAAKRRLWRALRWYVTRMQILTLLRRAARVVQMGERSEQKQ